MYIFMMADQPSSSSFHSHDLSHQVTVLSSQVTEKIAVGRDKWVKKKENNEKLNLAILEVNELKIQRENNPSIESIQR